MISAKPRRPILYWGGEMLTLILTFLISIYIFKGYSVSKLDLVVLSGFMLFWLLIEQWDKLYYPDIKNELNLHWVNHVKAYTIYVILVGLFYFSFSIPLPNKKGIVSILIGYPVLGFAINFLLLSFIRRVKNAKEQTKYTLVAGVGNLAKHVESEIFAHHVPGYQIKGYINCKKNERCLVGQDKVVSSLKDIKQYLQDNPVDEIVIALPGRSTREIQNILTVADYHGIRVKYIPDYQHIFGRNYKITRWGQIDAVNIRQSPLDGRMAIAFKSVFDKVFSFCMLLFLAPLFCTLAVLIKLDSPGPVFYCPIRVGKGGKAFKVYKFRSMHECDAAAGGTLSTQVDDPRITKIGKFMRKYSIDELPQFINVLIGNMSVVGPRPHRRYLNQQLQESVGKYMVRHYVKPGITGWAQVNGWRGPTDTDEQKRQRTLHDLWYIENWSAWLDIKIVFLTIFSKKVHQGAY